MTRRTEQDLIEIFCQRFIDVNGAGQYDRPSPVPHEFVRQIRNTRDAYPDADVIWYGLTVEQKAESVLRLHEIYDNLERAERMIAKEEWHERAS